MFLPCSENACLKLFTFVFLPETPPPPAPGECKLREGRDPACSGCHRVPGVQHVAGHTGSERSVLDAEPITHSGAGGAGATQGRARALSGTGSGVAGPSGSFACQLCQGHRKTSVVCPFGPLHRKRISCRNLRKVGCLTKPHK